MNIKSDSHKPKGAVQSSSCTSDNQSSHACFLKILLTHPVKATPLLPLLSLSPFLTPCSFINHHENIFF